MMYSAKNCRTVERTALYTWLCPKNYVILQINKEVGKGTLKCFPDLVSAPKVKKTNLDIYKRTIKK